jgi:hypothetical protein
MGQGVFLASHAPCVTVPKEHILHVFPETDAFFMPARDVFELPRDVYQQYLTLSERLMAKIAVRQARRANLWQVCKTKLQSATAGRRRANASATFPPPRPFSEVFVIY